MKNKLNRRNFLKLAGFAAAGALLAGCGKTVRVKLGDSGNSTANDPHTINISTTHIDYEKVYIPLVHR